jgi:hypothetical protein
MTLRPLRRTKIAVAAFVVVALSSVARAVWTDDVTATRMYSAAFSPDRVFSAATGWQPVADRVKSGSWQYEVWVRAKIWTLLGEPIVVCDVAYRPSAGGRPPDGVRPTTIVVDLPSPLDSSGGAAAEERVLCDGGILSSPVRGQAPVEDDFSFTVPSAPGWNRLVTRASTVGWSQGDPRGAEQALKAKHTAQDDDAAAARSQYAKLCPTHQSRGRYRGWRCAGQHQLVWDGATGHNDVLCVTRRCASDKSSSSGAEGLLLIDIDVTDYNLRLAQQAVARAEADLQRVTAQHEAEQRARAASAEGASTDDFWHTPADTRTREEARVQEQAVAQARSAITHAERSAAALQQTQAEREGREGQRRERLTRERGHDLCEAAGGIRSASSAGETQGVDGDCKRPAARGGSCEKHTDCEDGTYCSGGRCERRCCVCRGPTTQSCPADTSCGYAPTNMEYVESYVRFCTPNR